MDLEVNIIMDGKMHILANATQNASIYQNCIAVVEEKRCPFCVHPQGCLVWHFHKK